MNSGFNRILSAMSRREQLIQAELWKLLWVPLGRTQQEHKKWLQSLITWHPLGQDSSKPFAPKPPLTMKTLRMLALIRVVDKLLAAAKPEKPQFRAAADEPRTGDTFPHNKSRKRDRWIRLTKTIIPIAVAALAGFAGGYNSRSLSRPVEVVVARRAIPVKPEIRRAVPLQVEIRKAIAVHTRERRASK